jgi:hypothetical protein
LGSLFDFLKTINLNSLVTMTFGMIFHGVMRVLSNSLYARLWLAVQLCVIVLAPLHLADEIHALLPASARHHTSIHQYDHVQRREFFRAINGKEHERHHEVKCSLDGIFAFTQSPNSEKAVPLDWYASAMDVTSGASIMPFKFTEDALKGTHQFDRIGTYFSIDYCLGFGRGPPLKNQAPI